MASSMNHEEEYGFDVPFISETPEYIKCPLCTLVLRNPVQIIQCGHKFCAPCFGRMKSYAQQMGTQLRCPTDRDVIDLERVFDDHGLWRAIACLSVRCRQHESGCDWQGELSDIDTHDRRCEFRHPVVVAKEPTDDNGVAIKDMLLQLDRCEESLKMQEKENSHLRFQLGEQDKQILELKKFNTAMEQRVKVLEDSNTAMTMKHNEEMKALGEQIQLMRQEVEGKEIQLKTSPTSSTRIDIVQMVKDQIQ